MVLMLTLYNKGETAVYTSSDTCYMVLMLTLYMYNKGAQPTIIRLSIYFSSKVKSLESITWNQPVLGK